MVEPNIFHRAFLGRAGTRNVVLWTGVHQHGLYARDLGDDGAPLGPPREVVTSDGLLGYGLLDAGGELRAVYANERAAGERRLCAAYAGPVPRLPDAHPVPLQCTR
jgi:hypothetical protein